MLIGLVVLVGFFLLARKVYQFGQRRYFRRMEKLRRKYGTY